MRKCLRCGSEMKEGCAIKVEGAGYGIVLSDDATKLFSGRIGKPNVAICQVRRGVHLPGGRGQAQRALGSGHRARPEGAQALAAGRFTEATRYKKVGAPLRGGSL